MGGECGEQLDRLVRTSQPSKLRIQGRDCLGGGLDMRNGTLDELQRSVQLGLSSGSLVAPVGSSAARPNTAQFLGGLVEQAARTRASSNSGRRPDSAAADTHYRGKWQKMDR